MGDWSDNLEYEQREYYGHFYDTDREEETEEETDGLIAKQKVLATLDFADKALDEERTVETYKELLTECIKALPPVQPKKGEPTKGEVMDFPNTFDEFAEQYGFIDKEIVYTNGSHLIPVFRVKQWLEHNQPKKEDNTMDIYSDLLRVKHGTMSIDSLIDKVWCRER